MQILNFQFKPTLLGIVVTLIAVSIFTYLSVWQMGRSEERKQLRNEIVQRSAQASKSGRRSPFGNFESRTQGPYGRSSGESGQVL